jgi:predicted ATPase/class 3 adenylate cyclase
MAFLFTDIEQSTANVVALGDERYADLQDVHRALVRDAMHAHGGIERGTEGDAFFVVFEDAAAAVAAALDAQRAIELHDWAGHPVRLRIRVGVHAGAAVVRDGDYVGFDVNKAKRVADAGHGGQVLVSDAVRKMVEVSSVPGGSTWTDLGVYRLKDVPAPERLHQVTADGLQSDFPALRARPAGQRHLPSPLTTFVGRREEVRHVHDLIADSRLVTLTGVGGCGKTRLALAAAAQVDDEALFCDLSDVGDDDDLRRVLARALGMDAAGGASGSTAEAWAFVTDRLEADGTLLVLDNCEHVVDAAAELVEDLLQACPGLRVLATSREGLDAAGERVWSVPSLDLDADAVRLFAVRAKALRPDFELGEELEHVRAICRRLDGLPLAIELAAAQVSHLGVSQIAGLLDDRFATLTGGRRRVQCQQTLQAAMDWSWDLLDEAERRLLARIAVFHGFDLAAAAEVCGHDGVDVVRGLRSLVLKSLVRAEHRDGTVRYGYLQTVRMYAESRLVESGEADAIRDRHRDHYVGLLERRTEQGTETFFSNTSLDEEAENIRAAWRWSEAQGRWNLVARLLVTSVVLWRSSGDDRSREEAAEAALAAGQLDHELAGRLHACLAYHQMGVRGDVAAADASAAAALDRLEGPSPWRYLALTTAAYAAATSRVKDQSDGGSLRFADQALEVCDALGDAWAASGHGTRGTTLLARGRIDEAAVSYARALRPTLENPPRHPIHTGALDGIGACRYAMADRWTSELEDVWQRAKSFVEGPAVPALALELAGRGRPDLARQPLDAWLQMVRGRAPRLALRVLLVYAGAVAGLALDWPRAAQLLGAGAAGGIILNRPAMVVYQHALAHVRRELDPDEGRRWRDLGREMPLEHALDFALDPAWRPLRS